MFSKHRHKGSEKEKVNLTIVETNLNWPKLRVYKKK